ncbi:MAG: carboxylate--amine ligase [Anaerolineae bacterium]|nr:carboxylate--amine ligase [Anaerolineae bacterium]MDK1080290.1 carboxylate--amine ligase [Anaerolineae bacterium]
MPDDQIKVIIGGAGGAPSEGVINSLLRSGDPELIYGMGSIPTDLVLSSAKKKFLVPISSDPAYEKSLLTLLDNEKPNLLHFQNDLEIFEISKMREKILEKGVTLYMPPHDVIDTCVHKYKSYLCFKNSGLKVPENIFINNSGDLKKAFSKLGSKDGKIWLRASSIGGGGQGSLPTNDFSLAKGWIDHYHGWGAYIASEMLTPDSATSLSIWHNGKLIVAQSRKREGWIHGNRTVSGVTGVTKVGRTISCKTIDMVAMASVKAVSPIPHGIYGVDMTYDSEGVPNPTEINISRFFTTILFFTEAGLNMPKIFKDIALYGKFPNLGRKINPLPNGLLWLRSMDRKPELKKQEDLQDELIVY